MVDQGNDRFECFLISTIGHMHGYILSALGPAQKATRPCLVDIFSRSKIFKGVFDKIDSKKKSNQNDSSRGRK